MYGYLEEQVEGEWRALVWSCERGRCPVLTYAVVKPCTHICNPDSSSRPQWLSGDCEPRSAAPAVHGKVGTRVDSSTVWAQSGTILRRSNYLGHAGRVGERRRYGDLLARIGRKGSPIPLSRSSLAASKEWHTQYFSGFSQPLWWGELASEKEEVCQI